MHICSRWKVTKLYLQQQCHATGQFLVEEDKSAWSIHVQILRPHRKHWEEAEWCKSRNINFDAPFEFKINFAMPILTRFAAHKSLVSVLISKNRCTWPYSMSASTRAKNRTSVKSARSGSHGLIIWPGTSRTSIVLRLQCCCPLPQTHRRFDGHMWVLTNVCLI